jgi:hypothetical protein
MNSVFSIFINHASRAHGNFLIGQNILACTPNQFYFCNTLDRYSHLYITKRKICFLCFCVCDTLSSSVKGKAVPLQAWRDPEGSRKLRFPDFMTTAQDGGKVVSLTHRPTLPPTNTPDTHSC